MICLDMTVTGLSAFPAGFVSIRYRNNAVDFIRRIVFGIRLTAIRFDSFLIGFPSVRSPIFILFLASALACSLGQIGSYFSSVRRENRCRRGCFSFRCRKDRKKTGSRSLKYHGKISSKTKRAAAPAIICFVRK